MRTPRLRHLYDEYRRNQWMRYFAVFCRIALALGFLPSGIVKVTGERFTALPSTHPLGQYFDALMLTGAYYTFIGASQLVVALLLVIPRTALLGAMLYFPIIVNIVVIAHATRFEGTRITMFMLLANLFLLAWDYDRLKHVLPFTAASSTETTSPAPISRRFPWEFFGGVLATMIAIVVVNINLFDIRPGNSELECTNGCRGGKRSAECLRFCNCIYKQGNALKMCVTDFRRGTN